MSATRADRILRLFLEGAVTAADLAVAFRQPLDPLADVSVEPSVSPPLAVSPTHLVIVCDAVLAETLPRQALHDIGFMLLASDEFAFDGDAPDGERVARVAADWAAPEVNWPLSLRNAHAWRAYLTSGQKPKLEAG